MAKKKQQINKQTKKTRKGGSEAAEHKAVLRRTILIYELHFCPLLLDIKNETTLDILTIAYVTLLDPGMECSTFSS